MGLEALSTPMRLAAVIGATAIILLLAMGMIVRRRKSAAASIAAQGNLSEDMIPSSETQHDISSEHSSNPQDPSLGLTPNTASDNATVIPENRNYLAPQVTDNLKTILKLSELIATTAPSNELRQYAKRIRITASDTTLLLDNAELSSDLGKAELTAARASINFSELIKAQKKKWSTMIVDEDIQVTCFLDDKIPECLFLDPKILNRIIDSLMTNSRNLTKEGRIHLHITGENAGDYDWVIKMIIADTGIGFANDFKTRINSQDKLPKAQTLEQVNLIAVSHLATLMDGRFSLKSVEGRGTEIMVAFPSRTAMVMAENDRTGSKQHGTGSLSGRRVLIIEDDLSSQEVLKTFLKPEGCTIDCIDDGVHALKTLEQRPYDLVLMDVRMNGLDGIKTTRAIRRSQARFRDVPIIAITADTSPETNAKCMMAGADLFLTKPVSAKGLFDAIRFVMDLGTDIRPPSQNSKSASAK